MSTSSDQLVREGSGRQDTAALLRRHAATREPRDLDELARRFRPLARKLALRYARGGEQTDDIEQVALLGLVKAIQRFDPDRGYAFSSFAVPTILGELKKHFRNTAWALHVPRPVQERHAAIRNASDDFLSLHRSAPTPRELAAMMGCGEEEVVEALGAGSALEPASLDRPHETDDGESAALVDRLGGPDAGYETVDDRAAIAAALPLLRTSQREVLRLRFEEGLKQSEIAERIGVSQMQVSRLVRSALTLISTVADQPIETT